MRKLSFNSFLNEYIVRLESNLQNNPSNHPLFSLVKSTYTGIRNKYLYILISEIVFLMFLVGSFYYFIFIKNDDNLFGYIVLHSIFFTLYLIIVFRYIRIPDFEDIDALSDRVFWVRDKIKNYPFEYKEVKDMILNIDSIYFSERIAYLKRYHELVSSDISKPRKDDPSSLEKYLCLRLIVDELKTTQKDEESRLLVASILRVGSKELVNNETRFNLIDKILFDDFLDNIDLKKSEKVNVEKLYKELDKAWHRFNNALKLIESLKTKIGQKKL